MGVLIAVPVFRVGCRVGIDRGRAWTVIDELILWAVHRQSHTITDLVESARLPRQLILASISRLMRFRLIEVTVREEGAAFRASAYGLKSITSGHSLPFFPKRISKRVSFVVEWATGDFFPAYQVRLMAPPQIEQEKRSGTEVRTVAVRGGSPPMWSGLNEGKP